MYAIAQVIYGIPLNDNNGIVEQSEKLEYAIEDHDPGFLTFYSGHGEAIPSAFGIAVDEFDEACHHVDLSKLRLVPMQTDQDAFQELWDQLDEELKTEITTKYGTPRMFFLWSTS
jgi:hypothetical protein